jgi:hypothetical protein
MSVLRKTIAAGAFAALASAQTAPRLDAPCVDVAIFMARGNDAPYHDGRTTPFIDATCAKFTAEGKTCDYMDIVFDVTRGAPYCPQIAEGAANGISQVTAYNAKCPCTHIVINGYSEGAQVVGDVLGGPGGCTFVSNGIDNNSAAGKASTYSPTLYLVNPHTNIPQSVPRSSGVTFFTPPTSPTTSSMAPPSKPTRAPPTL